MSSQMNKKSCNSKPLFSDCIFSYWISAVGIVCALILTGCSSKPKNCEELFAQETKKDFEKTLKVLDSVKSPKERDTNRIMVNLMIEGSKSAGKELDQLGYSVEGCYEIYNDIHHRTETVTCERCNGSGYVSQQWLNEKGITSWIPGNCKLCNGKGEVTPLQQESGKVQAKQQAEADRKNQY
jgi:DnaJ-class molecular chaperone